MIHSRLAPPHQHCAIAHHHPGRWVTWNQYDKGHAVIKTDTGGYVRMSCGPLNPLRVTR